MLAERNASIAPRHSFAHERAEQVRQLLPLYQADIWAGSKARKLEEALAVWPGSRQAVVLVNCAVALDASKFRDQLACAENASRVGTNPRTSAENVHDWLNRNR